MQDLIIEIGEKLKQLNVSVKMLRKSGTEYAQAENDYKILLSQESLKLKDSGMAVTLIDKVVPVSGTYIRQNPIKYWKYIVREYRNNLCHNILITGTASEAIQMFPTKVNVTVAASRASVGPKKMQVTMQSTPGFKGDTQRVEICNEQVHAVVDVYSATAEIAGWSVVNTLRNLCSPIVFV